eukprot:180826-Hanusia_phi.AAC.12
MRSAPGGWEWSRSWGGRNRRLRSSGWQGLEPCAPPLTCAQRKEEAELELDKSRTLVKSLKRQV